MVALRYHNVYGPDMPRATPYSGVAAIFHSALEKGEPPRVFEDGGQMRDFGHVDDVAAANLAALACRDGFTAVNVCSGQPISILQMATALCDARGGAVAGGHRPVPQRRRPATSSPTRRGPRGCWGFAPPSNPAKGCANSRSRRYGDGYCCGGR